MSAKLARGDYDQAVLSAFRFFAKANPNQGLTRNEFNNLFSSIPKGSMNFALTTQVLDYLFSQADVNKDGFVSLLELQNFMFHFYLQ